MKEAVKDQDVGPGQTGSPKMIFIDEKVQLAGRSCTLRPAGFLIAASFA